MSINAKPKNLIYKNLNITQIIHAPNKNLYKDRYSLGTSSKPKIPKPVNQRIFIPKSVKNEKLHTKAIRNSSTISSMASTRWNKENFTKYQTKIIKLPRERSRSAKKPTTNLSAKSSPPSSTAGESNEETNHHFNILTNCSNLPAKNEIIHQDCNNQIQNLKNSTSFSLEITNKNNFNNNNQNQFTINNTNPAIRSITDIRDEYLITKKTSESIQSKILSETNPQINDITNQYKMMLSQKEKNNPLLFSLQSNINNICLGVFTSNYENYKINMQKAKSVNFTSNEYRQLLDTYTMLEYGESILNDLFEKQETIPQPLKNHEITPRMRMKMVDWMVEVFSNVKTSENTFFMSVNIMDRFFKFTQDKYKPNDLHLIGLCCIFISSKFCDIYPIKLKVLIEKIGHNKFQSDDILKMENNIMKCLKYDILKPTIFDFMNFYFEDLFYFFENNFNIKNKVLGEYLKEFVRNLNIKITLDNIYYDKCSSAEKYTENMRYFLRCVLNYLLKMCCHDYEIISEKPSLVAASVILVGMKICEEVNSIVYVNDYFMNKLSTISKDNQYDILSLSSKILSNAQHFEEIYSGMNNLHKTHFAALNQINNTK